MSNLEEKTINQSSTSAKRPAEDALEDTRSSKKARLADLEQQCRELQEELERHHEQQVAALEAEVEKLETTVEIYEEVMERIGGHITDEGALGDEFVDRSPRAAFMFYKLGVQNNSTMCCYPLGELYLKGVGDCESGEAEEEAFSVFKQGAEAGDRDAILALAECYKNGTGVEKDEVLAKQWEEKAEAL